MCIKNSIQATKEVHRTQLANELWMKTSIGNALAHIMSSLLFKWETSPRAQSRERKKRIRWNERQLDEFEVFFLKSSFNCRCSESVLVSDGTFKTYANSKSLSNYLIFRRLIARTGTKNNELCRDWCVCVAFSLCHCATIETNEKHAHEHTHDNSLDSCATEN